MRFTVALSLFVARIWAQKGDPYRQLESLLQEISPFDADFGACSCDLTEGGCDANCCCDSDCSALAIEGWKLGGQCSEYSKFGATLPYDECIEKYQRPILDDLRGGLYVYEKILRQLLCTTNAAPRSVAANFIDSVVRVTD
jgi:hypothetical protein